MMLKNRADWVMWELVSVALLVYLFFLTKNYFFDGIAFAQTIEAAQGLYPSLLHPSHLIYNVVGYLAYKAIRIVGIPVRALEVLQIMNSVLSVLCALVLFQILRSALRSIYLCSALTLLFAFSATWWKFSTDADAYIPSVLFILISFYLILPARRPKPLLVALTFSASMAFHQLAVLFFPVLVLGLFLQTGSLGLKQRAMTTLQFSAAAFVITFTAYYYGSYLATRALSLTSFLRWVTYHSPDTSFGFSFRDNLIYSLRGQVRLFFGGRFNLIKGLINPFVAALIAILIVLFLFFSLSLIGSFEKFSWRKRAIRIDQRNKPLVLLCGLWIFVYNLFLFFWLPFHTFYRLFYLPALIILAGLLISSASGETAERKRRYRAASLVVIIALSNFLFLIFPYSHAQKWPPMAMTLEMNKRWPQGTTIYYAQDNSDNSLFRYFNPASVWKPLDPLKVNALESDLQNIYSQSNTAWIEASAIDLFSSSREGEQWLSAHAVKGSLREINDPAFKIKFIQIAPRSYDTNGADSHR